MKEIDLATRKKKLAALGKVMKSLAKETGDENAIQILGVKPIDEKECLPTGFLTLDVACGGFGVKRGRIVELFGYESCGKSLIAQKMVGAVQAKGGLCAFVDMEQTFEPSFARKLGVNTDELALSQPDSMQNAFKIIDGLIDAGVDLIILDSVAALVPEEEMEAEAGKQTIGLVARYMSQFLRRINVKLAKTESVVVFINQIRQKIGVLYGCFHADTNIVFADGSLHSIKEVVENKLEGPILSYNSDTGTIKEEKIINWFNNGKLQDGQCWLSFKTTSNYQSVNGFTCTPNHQILKSNGEYCCAEDLKIGDKLISYKTEKIIHNQIYKEMIFASMLGDGTLSIRSGHTASFLLANKQQEEYLQWKLEKLKYLNFKLKTTKKHCYYSEYSTELKDFYNFFYKKKIDGKMTRTIPDGLTLTPLMAAIWYMDDGNTHRRQGRICISRIQKLNKDEYDHQVFLLKKIVSDFIGCNIDKLEYSEKDNQLKIKTDEFAIFCSKIEKYVIPSMQYKLIPECQGKYEDFDSGNLNIITQKADFVEITEIAKNSKRKMRSQTKYDIEVENQHCYFVGGSHGVVVHNSPDTTGGGTSLKFYSSIRMQVSKNADGMIKEKDKVVGQGIRVRIVKNKTAPPFRVAEFSVYFDGRKQSETDQIASIAIENGLIPKYNAKGERDKNGRQYKWNTVPEFLAKSKAEVPEMLDKFPQVREELLEMIKNGTYNEDEQSSELEADMDDESFEEMIKNESFSEAEEIESDFDEV